MRYLQVILVVSALLASFGAIEGAPCKQIIKKIKKSFSKPMTVNCPSRTNKKTGYLFTDYIRDECSDDQKPYAQVIAAAIICEENLNLLAYSSICSRDHIPLTESQLRTMAEQVPKGCNELWCEYHILEFFLKELILNGIDCGHRINTVRYYWDRMDHVFQLWKSGLPQYNADTLRSSIVKTLADMWSIPADNDLVCNVANSEESDDPTEPDPAGTQMPCQYLTDDMEEDRKTTTVDEEYFAL